MFCVSVKVGTREFIGQGANRQLARHQAATKALACLRQLVGDDLDKDDESPSEAQQPSEISTTRKEIVGIASTPGQDVIKESPSSMANPSTTTLVESAVRLGGEGCLGAAYST